MRSQDPLPETIVVPTDFGPVLLAWVKTGPGPRVVRIALPKDRSIASPSLRKPRRVTTGDEKIDALAGDIQSFLSGNDVFFRTDLLDLEWCRPFQRRVLLAEHGIPRGSVSTYGQIARYIGVPGGARAVGNALAHNPFPIVIPCHRALRSDGSPGGFQGGLSMKARLLEMEGARFRPDGRVVMDHVWY